jgi:hypothetical protein
MDHPTLVPAALRARCAPAALRARGVPAALRARCAPAAGQSAQSGQATAEYALVVLGASAVAALVLAWAARTGKITALLNAVIDAVIGRVT